jgi:putative DNA primase/helicase
VRAARRESSADSDRIVTNIPRSLASRIADAAPLTEGGNSERFVAQHGEQWRFNCDAGAWLRWDGRRWAPDLRGEVRAAARETVSRLLDEARHMPDGDERRQLIRHALKSDTARAVTGMLDLAKPSLTVVTNELDSDPFALNVANGTVDLRDGSLRPHTRELFCTKLAPVEYDPAARSDLWESLLTDALGDAETIGFFQRAVGYTATADTREEKLFAVLGPAASGKSTIIEGIKTALGDYARTSNFETFCARTDVGSPRQDIARLAGARFVSSIEVEDGRRLASGLVKTLTGNDTIAARFLYSKEFEFRATFKLWLVANDAPRVRHEDEGLWRRIVRIPFERVLLPARRDPTLKARLREPEHLRAILAWVVAGAVAWHAHGLQVPTRIEAATESYRADMSPVKSFFEDCALLDAVMWTSALALRERYDQWCLENGWQPVRSGKVFAALLRSHGLKESKRCGVRGWCGVALAGGR